VLPGSLEAGRNVLLVPPYAASKRVTAFFAAIGRIPHIVRAWSACAESRRALAMLNDHLLRDIGLTRGDVERELMTPFWRE
jgi:uncharacterized protein YjiS (DUF1127 family)